MIKSFLIFSTLLVSVLFTGCSSKLDIYNKPAIFWLNKISESIADNDLDDADEYWTSLMSEHAGSPLLPEATIILAEAHLYQGDYLLSEHYLKTYIRRWANPDQREYAEFLIIKAKYFALPWPRRDQGLIEAAVIQGDEFKRNYPHSTYYPIVDTMVTRLYLADAYLNESIALLYERIDKPKGAEYYRNIEPQPWINWEQVEAPDEPFYRYVFTGDGKGAWYGFLIPNTQSVVSMYEDDDEVVITPDDIAVPTAEEMEEGSYPRDPAQP